MDEELDLADSALQRPAPDAPDVRTTRRHSRNAFADLLIPVAAIAAVGLAIVVIQLYKEQSSGGFDRSTGGAFSRIDIGPQGGGSPSIGKSAPGFQLIDASGNAVELDAFRGKPVLLNFWATWCVPCRREMPDFVDAQEEWGDSVQILGVNYGESATTVSEFATTFDINYPLPLDGNGRVTASYKLTGLPETYFIDAAGTIRDHRIGQLRPAVMRCIVSNILHGAHNPSDCR